MPSLLPDPEPWEAREAREDDRDRLAARLDLRDRRDEHAGLDDHGFLPHERRALTDGEIAAALRPAASGVHVTSRRAV